jgi:hypothetical protein
VIASVTCPAVGTLGLSDPLLADTLGRAHSEILYVTRFSSVIGSWKIPLQTDSFFLP